MLNESRECMHVILRMLLGQPWLLIFSCTSSSFLLILINALLGSEVLCNMMDDTSSPVQQHLDHLVRQRPEYHSECVLVLLSFRMFHGFYLRQFWSFILLFTFQTQIQFRVNVYPFTLFLSISSLLCEEHCLYFLPLALSTSVLLNSR